MAQQMVVDMANGGQERILTGDSALDALPVPGPLQSLPDADADPEGFNAVTERALQEDQPEDFTDGDRAALLALVAAAATESHRARPSPGAVPVTLSLAGWHSAAVSAAGRRRRAGPMIMPCLAPSPFRLARRRSR